MKVQKTISILATLSILSFAVACKDGDKTDRYAEGFAAGKAEGYIEGYEDGYIDGEVDGYARAEAFFKTADYTQGFNDGRTLGTAEGYAEGYIVGKSDGLAEGYTNGYNAGYTDGDLDGYAEGYTAGDTDGFAAGFEQGFDDGYAQAEFDYGLSVGKTPKLQGYANVLSMFHNDLIDYSKIKSPVETKKGLVANGQLLLSEVSMTNKDTLKRTAVIEQYLVVEMAKQVKGKFGLSAERSLKVAKAANHFRKFATTRALTAEDTNAYAIEIIGVSFKAVEKAYENSMKGNFSDLNQIMDKAAEKNEVTPEKMSEITKLFI